ncbi:transglycosylase SLT domain-containing protein [Hyalangium versicolor]|uniref:transglycosylase SLT domain-containing protein n=1 Tax=Hyalangium versicolor TaxID=2861190 RepID=UPI001CCA84E0|nr:transglycosylase SLT domain-containing protein [Hyalangium versicolor]
MQNRTARTREHREARMKEAAAHAPHPNALLSKFLPKGASVATARQDGLSAGICASHKLARTDLPRLLKHQSAFEAAALKHGLPPALLAALASRESRAGALLDNNGLVGGGECFGLMQLDSRYRPRGGAHSAEHIDHAAQVLARLLGEVKAMHPGWPAEQQLRGAVVAYDSGVGHVRTIRDMDRGTTGDDYSNDVWARAQALVPHFGGMEGASANGEVPGTSLEPMGFALPRSHSRVTGRA